MINQGSDNYQKIAMQSVFLFLMNNTVSFYGNIDKPKKFC